MKIVIIGLGTIGRTILKNLSREGHTVTIIDEDKEKIERLRGGVIIDTKRGEIMASAEAELLGIFKMSDIADTVSDAPARIRGTRSGSVPVCRVKITITEGKKHQVKKMALAVGLRVIYLERIAISSLKLDKDLPRGEFRPLREDELSALGYSI